MDATELVDRKEHELILKRLKKFFLLLIILGNVMSIVILFLVRITTVNKDEMRKAFKSFEATVLFVMAIVMLFMSILALLGMIRESSCLMNVYSLCILIILLVQVAASLSAFQVYSGDVRLKISDSVLKYTENKELIDYLQNNWRCCGSGVDKFYEYWNQKLTMEDTVIVENQYMPASCCEIYSYRKCTALHKDDCSEKLDFWIDRYSKSLGGCGFFLSLIQICQIVISNRLAHAIKPVKTLRRIWIPSDQGIEVL